MLCWNPTPASLARAVTSLARAVRSHQYSDAFCDKNTVLKAFGNKYIALQYLAFCISSAGFQASAPTCCDGWWMVVVDGGWWSKKKFFNFAETWHTGSSRYINVHNFRVLVKQLSYGNEIQFQV